jgi:hypothetical protein
MTKIAEGFLTFLFLIALFPGVLLGGYLLYRLMVAVDPVSGSLPLP